MRLSISYRGWIWDTKKRDAQLPKYLYIRFVLLILEFFAAIVCLVATYNPDLISEFNCNSYHVAIALAETSSAITMIKFVGSVVKSCIYIDPCGFFTPGLLQYLSFLDTADDVGETPTPLLRPRSDSWLARILHLQTPLNSVRVTARPSSRTSGRNTSNISFWQHQVSLTHTVHGAITPEELSRQISRYRTNYIGLRRLQRRLRILFCCLGVGGHRSRRIALEDIARALYTLFDFKEEGEGEESVKVVLSDIIAGFKLMNHYQLYKLKELEEGERLEDKFRKVKAELHYYSRCIVRVVYVSQVTFDYMPLIQKPHYQYKSPLPFLNESFLSFP